MSPAELQIERNYLIIERIGIMCGDKAPTNEQMKIAIEEADRAIGRLDLVNHLPNGARIARKEANDAVEKMKGE